VGGKLEIEAASAVAAAEESLFSQPREHHDLAARIDSSLLSRELLPLYLETGCLPVSSNGGTVCLASTNPVEAIPPALAEQFHAKFKFVSARRSEILEALEKAFRHVLCEEATYDLERNEPQFSARRVITVAQVRYFALAATILIASLLLVPALAGVLLTGVVAAGYLANAVFRGWLFWIGSEFPNPQATVERASRENEWPLYTILVPLYREAKIVPLIVRALSVLDYPPERLDVKLVVEADDRDTVEAAHLASEQAGFEVLHVPVGEPRTKPRACNYALRFARGEFLVIYDAEDQPEPDQLKKAVGVFRNGPSNLACLQARLNFFNAKENWLTRGMLAQRVKTPGSCPI
jgi:hypothetical protein